MLARKLRRDAVKRPARPYSRPWAERRQTTTVVRRTVQSSTLGQPTIFAGGMGERLGMGISHHVNHNDRTHDMASLLTEPRTPQRAPAADIRKPSPHGPQALFFEAAGRQVAAVSCRRIASADVGGTWENAVPVNHARSEYIRSSLSGAYSGVRRSCLHGGSIESIQASTVAHEIRAAQAQVTTRVVGAYQLSPPSPSRRNKGVADVHSQGSQGLMCPNRPRTRNRSSPPVRGTGRGLARTTPKTAQRAALAPAVYSIYTL